MVPSVEGSWEGRAQWSVLDTSKCNCSRERIVSLFQRHKLTRGRIRAGSDQKAWGTVSMDSRRLRPFRRWVAGSLIGIRRTLLRTTPFRPFAAFILSLPNPFHFLSLMFLRVSPCPARRTLFVDRTAASRFNRKSRFRPTDLWMRIADTTDVLQGCYSKAHSPAVDLEYDLLTPKDFSPSGGEKGPVVILHGLL